mgnify:CR=1 FL=1
MNKTLKRYKTILFDCDGVILNSNKLKSAAFKKVSKKFGATSSEALLTYNIENGGVSRFEKFRWFFYDYLKFDNCDKIIERSLEEFSEIVRSEMLNCEMVPGLEKLINYLYPAKCGVVSGSAQIELRDIFLKRDILKLFSCGVYGSPLSKYEIFDYHIQKGNFERPILYIGDSKLDHLVSEHFKCDFLFVSQWTEFKNWQDYINSKGLFYVKSLNELFLKKVSAN